MPNVSVIAILNLLAGVVSFLISYYAYKNNKLVGSILLRYISTGFLILGVGLVLQAGTEWFAGITEVEAARERGLEFAALILYTLLQVIAYGVFAWGYGLSAFLRKQAAAGTAVPVILAGSAGSKLVASKFVTLAIYVASQIAVIVLLFVIVIQGVRVFTHSKSNLALMVLFGFTLIFMGHLLMLGAVLSSHDAVFLVGNAIEFCGFLSLLIFLVWSGRVGK